MQGSEDKQTEQGILIDLRYEIARKMPVEATAREMLQDGLLTPQQWEIYTTKSIEERGEYLLDCLQPGCLEKFCSVLHKVGAEDLVKEISRYRKGSIIITVRSTITFKTFL